MRPLRINYSSECRVDLRINRVPLQEHRSKRCVHSVYSPLHSHTLCVSFQSIRILIHILCWHSPLHLCRRCNFLFFFFFVSSCSLSFYDPPSHFRTQSSRAFHPLNGAKFHCSVSVHGFLLYFFAVLFTSMDRSLGKCRAIMNLVTFRGKCW